MAEAKLGTTSLSAEQTEWVDAFYRNVQNRMLNLYEAARLEGSKIRRPVGDCGSLDG
jgi:hypothetical protein